MPAARRIGMFDSGLGGLTVLGAVQRKVGAVDVVYYADTAHVPYGDRALEEVSGFARAIIGKLLAEDPALIAIACGTTCSAFDRLGWPQLPVPLIGLVGPGARAAARASRNGSIGVVATNATVRSGVFERALKAVRADANVTGIGAPALVPLVESGRWDSDEARAAVAACCAGLRAAGCDTVILGCTHFPHLRRWFADALGPDVRLIDPAHAVADEVAALIPFASGAGSVRFEVSGDRDAFLSAAARLTAVGVDI